MHHIIAVALAVVRKIYEKRNSFAPFLGGNMSVLFVFFSFLEQATIIMFNVNMYENVFHTSRIMEARLTYAICRIIHI
jgi:hypothetical protein